MNQDAPVDIDKIKTQIKKLLALSHSPFKAEADVALKKAKELMKIYNLGKVKIPHPRLDEYEMLLYRAFIESFNCIWHDKYAYGIEKNINKCQQYAKRCMDEMNYGITDCEKKLSQCNKNIIGVDFWYKKSFYNGLCEGLNVRAQFVNIVGVSHLDYGSQLFVTNNAHAHALGIGKYYVKHRNS